jgi:hypothetical protein
MDRAVLVRQRNGSIIAAGDYPLGGRGGGQDAARVYRDARGGAVRSNPQQRLFCTALAWTSPSIG